MKPTINPELQALIPPPSADELRLLEQSLGDDGCRDPLVVWLETNELLDGHNRFAICERNHWPYETHELSFPDMRAAKTWVLRNQLGRRNLTDAQRVAIALKLEETLAPAEERKKAGLKRGPARSQKSANGVDTRAEVAKAAGVSHDTVSKVKRVLRDGDEETKTAMLNGTVSINKAAQTVTPSRPRTKPRKAAVATEDENAALERCSRTIHEACDALLAAHPTMRAMVVFVLKQKIEELSNG